MNKLDFLDKDFTKDAIKKTNVAYTIASTNYLHLAITLRESFLKYNINYNFIIILMDTIKDKSYLKSIETLRNKGLDIRSFNEVKKSFNNINFEEMLIRYDVVEMNTALKPYALEYLYNEGYEKVIYLDPDIYFTSNIGKLDKLLDSYDIILTPHTFEPFPLDGKEQHLRVIMEVGIYNLGFIATRNSENSRKMAKFWQQQLYNKCYNKVKKHMFTDQIWAEWFPSFYDKVYILRDRGYNAAFWNLHERSITKKDNILYANSDKLVFYHFSAFNPLNYQNISKSQNRFTLDDMTEEFKELCKEYSLAVLENGYEYFKQHKYFYGYFPCTNIKINSLVRKLFLRFKFNPYSSNECRFYKYSN